MGSLGYGFKLTGVTIPDDTTSLNAVISDGTTTNEYALTGSIADDFSGTGASATAPGELKLDETEVITDRPVDIDATASQWLDDKLTAGTISSVQVRIGTHILTYDGAEGGFTFIDGQIGYGLFYGGGSGASWFFIVEDLSDDSIIPGIYQLSIYDGSATFNLTINALTADDAGDNYTVSVNTSQPTPAIIDAIKKALNIPTKDGVYQLEISNSNISWYEGK